MMFLGLIPLVTGLLLAVTSRGLSRRLSPWLAAPLLTVLALVTALATGVVLGLAAFSTFARESVVAAAGGWSQMTWRPWDQMPAGWGILAALAVAGLLAAACLYLAHAVRDVTQASRACRGLAPEPGGLVIIRDEQPTAYAVTARAGAIVVSTGMLRLLDAPERRALLAHEAAHLRHHHSRYVLLAELAAAANPLLRPLAREVRLAVELWADQSAADEVGDRRAVARALARASLAAARQARGPGVGLAMAQTEVSARVRALIGTPPRRRRWAVAAALILTLASGSAALTMTWAMHQRVEAAQLAYSRARSHARSATPDLAGPRSR